MRKTHLALLLLSAALTSVTAAAAAATMGVGGTHSPAVTAGAFTYRGTVTRVVDGDTLDVRLTSGKTERVRLIGIDTPERGELLYLPGDRTCPSARDVEACRASRRRDAGHTRPLRAPARLRLDPRREGPWLSADRGRTGKGLCVSGRFRASRCLPQRGDGRETDFGGPMEGLPRDADAARPRHLLPHQ